MKSKKKKNVTSVLVCKKLVDIHQGVKVFWGIICVDFWVNTCLMVHGSHGLYW